MYEKNGEKYFIVDSHLHMWVAGPENWVKGQEQYAKGWIDCFHAYMGLGPPETHWPIEKFMSYIRRGLREGRLRGWRRRRRHVPVDVPEGVVHEGLQLGGAERCVDGRSTRTSSSSTGALTRATATPASSSSRRTPSGGNCRASSSTPRSGTTAPAAGAWTIRRPSRSLTNARSWGSRTSTSTRAPRSGPWTRTPLTPATSIRPRLTTRSSTSSSSTSGCRGSRTSASWQRRSPTSTPASAS